MALILMFACSVGGGESGSEAKRVEIDWYTETGPCVPMEMGEWGMRWDVPEEGLVMVQGMDWSQTNLAWTGTFAYEMEAGGRAEFRCAGSDQKGEEVTVTWGVLR